MKTVNEQRIIEQFTAFLQEAGITPLDENFTPMCDGELHRFPVEGDRHGATSGAYIIHTDGRPNWLVQDYHRHSEMLRGLYEFSREEKQEYYSQQSPASAEAQAQARAARKAEELKRQKECEQAAVLSAWREYNYPHSGDVTSHPYLEAKHISFEAAHCAGFNGYSFLQEKLTHSQGDSCRLRELMIPLVRADTGQFSSLVHIPASPNPGGKFPKFFYKGTHPKGCCAELIPYKCRRVWEETVYFPDELRTPRFEASYAFVCEGIATAFSVLELSDYLSPVLAACSCHNILHVARAWHRRYPDLHIIIAADHDKPGLEAALIAKNEGAASSIKIPPLEGQDWNDYLTHAKEDSHFGH